MFIRTVASLLVLAALTRADCPNGFIHHDSSCYHFSHDLEDWAGAQSICTVFGATQVEIDHAAESSFLTSQTKLKGYYYWTGGNDLATEGDWSWLSNSARLATSSFQYWAPGQPDNYRKNQNCMAISPGGFWVDRACNEANHHYICERPSGAQVDVIG